MTLRKKPARDDSKVEKAGAIPPNAVILYVQESELDELLERALASWRMPKWQWATIVGTVVLPILTILIAMRQVWNDPAAVHSVLLLGLGFMVFFLGTAVGRLLRPIPSQSDIRKFATQTQVRGQCGDFIEESRAIADSLGPEPSSANNGDLGDEALKFEFSVVDHAAMLRIRGRVQAMMHSASREARQPSVVFTLPTGTRAFYSPANCAGCEKALGEGDAISACESCGSPFCEECAKASPSGYDGSARSLLCSSCSVTSRQPTGFA